MRSGFANNQRDFYSILPTKAPALQCRFLGHDCLIDFIRRFGGTKGSLEFINGHQSADGARA